VHSFRRERPITVGPRVCFGDMKQRFPAPLAGHRVDTSNKNRSFEQRPDAYSFAQVIEWFR